jgi:hypothetical protein
MNHKYLSGEWNCLCDRCGFKFKSSELKKDWQGLMVCSKDYEARHPQDFIKVSPEKAIPEWTRPRTEDSFVEICYLWDLSGYAGLGAAGCMKAGNNTIPYSILNESKTGKP